MLQYLDISVIEIQSQCQSFESRLGGMSLRLIFITLLISAIAFAGPAKYTYGKLWSTFNFRTVTNTFPIGSKYTTK